MRGSQALQTYLRSARAWLFTTGEGKRTESLMQSPFLVEPLLNAGSEIRNINGDVRY